MAISRPMTEQEKNRERDNNLRELRRTMTLRVMNNGFGINTRSGQYVYRTREELHRAIDEYIDVIEKEIKAGQ